jgi:hypothetical protein
MDKAGNKSLDVGNHAGIPLRVAVNVFPDYIQGS